MKSSASAAAEAVPAFRSEAAPARVEPFRFGEVLPAPAQARPPAAVDPAQELEARIAATRADAHAEGLREGVVKGREEADARAREAVALLEKVLRRLNEERESLLATAEREILDLALAVASRILRREVAVDRDLVVRILSEALRRASPLEEVVVRVNPADYSYMKSVPGLEAQLAEIRHLALVEDRRVSAGGCLIETASGAIDARVEAQLEEIERALARTHGGADAGTDAS